MAVITTDALNLPNHKKVTLSGTPNTQQEFSISGKAERVEVQFVGAAGVVIFNGGTDGAVISSEVAYPVPADSSFWWDLPRSKQTHSIWVASGSASTVCHVIIYEA
tara:strand:- start:1377 stop:1694 length:318 start_codon:yes stop_codon:yes gene_type:complete